MALHFERIILFADEAFSDAVNQLASWLGQQSREQVYFTRYVLGALEAPGVTKDKNTGVSDRPRDYANRFPEESLKLLYSVMREGVYLGPDGAQRLSALLDILAQKGLSESPKYLELREFTGISSP